MKLYMHPFSQHSRRVLMLCEELGLSVEAVPMAIDKGEHKSEAFLKINPNGMIPVLDDGGFVLPESHAIMKYLVATAGPKVGSALYPADAKARSRIDMWLDWNHTRLNPPVQTIAIQTLVMGDNADTGLVASCHAQVADALHLLDRAMPAADGIGGSPTLADLSVASTVSLYEMSGADLKPWPAVSSWFDGIKARPGFKRTASQMAG